MSRPQDGIGALYEATLKPRLEALESDRLGVKGYKLKALVILGVPAVLLKFSDVIAEVLPDGVSGGAVTAGMVLLLLAAFVLVAVKYALPGFAAYFNYRARFKQEVVAEIFRIVCPEATYTPDRGIGETIFDGARLFSTRGSLRSDDLVRGRIGDTPFEAADVRRSYQTGGQHSTTVSVFEGLFFHLDFNKALRATTIVQPETARPTQLGDRSGLALVEMENPAFEQEFRVYASDPVEARYVLTPAMMERLLVLRSRAGRPVFLSFTGGAAYIGIDYGRPLFEPSVSSTTSREAVEEMAEHFALAATIVSELDLNTRIWTKGVDDALLRQPEAPSDPLTEATAAKARAGTLTAGDLWKAAKDLAARSNQGE